MEKPNDYKEKSRERIIDLIDEFCGDVPDRKQQAFADMCGVSKFSISQYVNGSNTPGNMNAAKIANKCNVEPLWIMGFDVSKYRHNSFTPPYPNIHPITTKTFPLFDGIAAGEPRLMPDGISLYVDSTVDVHADFVLKVHGDSMIGARINDGDYVFIRKQPEVENGEIAAVAIGDEATLKRVFWYANKSVLVLRAENPDYPDMELSGEKLEEVKIFGKAVAFQSDVR